MRLTVNARVENREEAAQALRDAAVLIDQGLLSGVCPRWDLRSEPGEVAA